MLEIHQTNNLIKWKVLVYMKSKQIIGLHPNPINSWKEPQKAPNMPVKTSYDKKVRKQKWQKWQDKTRPTRGPQSWGGISFFAPLLPRNWKTILDSPKEDEVSLLKSKSNDPKSKSKKKTYS